MAINCTKLKKPEYCILFKGIVLSIMGLIHTEKLGSAARQVNQSYFSLDINNSVSRDRTAAM